MSYPDISRQTIGEPLANPWYIPGFTAQNPNYLVLPTSPFNLPGFPTAALYVTVIGNFFDDDGNPISGFLTFYPSAQLQLTDPSTGAVTIIPQRFVGQNLYDVPGAFWGTGQMFLKNGQLQVKLLATDNAVVSMIPTTFTYQVTENWLGGRTYDIVVPSTDTTTVDINSLIIPGTIDEAPEAAETEEDVIAIAAVSTVYLPVNVTALLGGSPFNPTSSVVQFAFIAGPNEPQTSDWHNGAWASTNAPYVAQILIGPANGGLVLPLGSYIIWVKVISNPQVPVFSVGTLEIY